MLHDRRGFVPDIMMIQEESSVHCGHRSHFVPTMYRSSPADRPRIVSNTERGMIGNPLSEISSQFSFEIAKEEKPENIFLRWRVEVNTVCGAGVPSSRES